MEVLGEGREEEGTHRETDRPRQRLEDGGGVGSRGGEMNGLSWTDGRGGMDGWQLRFVYWQLLARHRRGRGMAAGTSEGS